MGEGEGEGEGSKAGVRERVPERARAGSAGEGATPFTLHDLPVAVQWTPFSTPSANCRTPFSQGVRRPPSTVHQENLVHLHGSFRIGFPPQGVG